MRVGQQVGGRCPHPLDKLPGEAGKLSLGDGSMVSRPFTPIAADPFGFVKRVPAP